jgi:hypothetical protein
MEEGEKHPPEIVNVNEIPSPDTTSVKPTPILEETQLLALDRMSIGILKEVQDPLNQDAETLKEVQPKNTESTLKVNGRTQNLKTTVEPEESQTTISNHPPEGTVEYVTSWSEWYNE